MSAEDFNNGQSGQNNQQFNDQPLRQTQAQERPGEQWIDNAGTDNFAPEDEHSVEEIDTDLTTESAGGAEPASSQDEDDDGI